MHQEISPKVAWVLVGLAVLLVVGLVWWFLIRSDSASRAALTGGGTRGIVPIGTIAEQVIALLLLGAARLCQYDSRFL